ncbi:cupredoxin domain-containing protein [uncultured Microbulbifer sp.]|uniref:cupredoxin domain-containing protein n=1 Tax=uncultured Microbulbifer sp. TaxID=348147 RepID=UPI002618DD54|nr:cupredoxin domain-containing protein [uncultured Microbulbifer sp.]
MEAVLVNTIGVLLIVAIIWWFWLGPRRGAVQAVEASEKLQILVRGGVYEPDHIRLPANQTATLHFRREDPSPCSEWVIIPDLGISAELELNQETSVEIPAAKPGKYPFSCQMQMYRGTLILE